MTIEKQSKRTQTYLYTILFYFYIQIICPWFDLLAPGLLTLGKPTSNFNSHSAGCHLPRNCGKGCHNDTLLVVHMQKITSWGSKKIV